MSSQAASFQQQFVDLPVSMIVESKTNPRKHFDEDKLQQLADSVTAHGVLVPILVRAAADGGIHELIAGARRYRAAKMAQIETVPVRICEMTDEEVLEVQVVENLQREDVHPLEEADGFSQLIAKYGYTVELLSEKIGRGEGYIYKRLKLADLSAEAKKLFLEAKLQLGHALLLCRLSSEQQHEALDDLAVRHNGHMIGGKWVTSKEPSYPSVSQFDLWIRANVYLDLSGAAWQKADAYLLPAAGACTSCSKRTGANSLLFDDVKKGDHCLDATCFKAKRDAHLVKIEKLNAAKGITLVRVATQYVDDRQLKALGAISSHSYSKITNKKERCGYSEEALVVHGNDIGHLINICRDSKCPTHGSHNRRSRDDGDKTPAGIAKQEAKRRKELLEKKIDLAYRRELVVQIAEHVPSHPGPRELAAIAERAAQGLRVDAQRAIGAAFGQDFRQVKERIDKMDQGEVVRFAVLCCVAEGAGEFAWEQPIKNLTDFALSYGIPIKSVEQKIAAPLREKFAKSEAKRKEREKFGKAAPKAAKKKVSKRAASTDESDGDEEGDNGGAES